MNAQAVVTVYCIDMEPLKLTVAVGTASISLARTNDCAGRVTILRFCLECIRA